MADIISTLEAAGFQVTCVADCHKGLSSIYQGRPDLVIVAEQVLGINGEELCSKMRQVSLLPIIVIGNSQEGSHGVRLLEAGADAYMSTPPDLVELVARVRSLLRRTKEPEGPSAGGDPGGNLFGRTAKRGNSGGLTFIKFHLLSCLRLNEGRLIRYPQLMAGVWGEKQVSRDCLKFYVRRLRQKLQGFLTYRIVNWRGVGYRLGARAIGEEGPG
jgi:DNA-binding response OmpR family regulator